VGVDIKKGRRRGKGKRRGEGGGGGGGGGGKDDPQLTTVQQLLKRLIYESQWERIPDVKHDTQIRRCNGRWGRKKPK